MWGLWLTVQSAARYSQCSYTRWYTWILREISSKNDDHAMLPHLTNAQIFFSFAFRLGNLIRRNFPRDIPNYVKYFSLFSKIFNAASEIITINIDTISLSKYCIRPGRRFRVGKDVSLIHPTGIWHMSSSSECHCCYKSTGNWSRGNSSTTRAEKQSWGKRRSGETYSVP